MSEYRDETWVDETTGASSGGEPSETEQSDQDMAQHAMDTAQQRGQQVAQTVQQKAGQLGEQAQQKADQGMDMAASGLGQAAQTIRQQGNQTGNSTVSGVATSAANTLDSASQYLREKDTAQVLDDLEALVRRKPVESVLVAAGIGFVLSKLFS